MARWLIKLEGQLADLDEYVTWFPSGEIFAIREDTDVFLAGPVFERLPDAEAVVKDAERQLALLTGIAALLWPSLRKPAIDRVMREQDDGTRNSFIFVFATASARAKVTATLADSSGPTQAQGLLNSAIQSPHLLLAVSLWGEKLKSWPRLYRILEEIEQHLGARVDEVGFCSYAERERFTRTANNAEVAGSDSRHASRKFQAPANPVELSEAVSFVARMLQAALRQP